MNKTKIWVASYIFTILMILMLIVAWENSFKQMDYLSEEQNEEEILSEEIEFDGLSEEALITLRDSKFGLSKLTETETHENFELYIKEAYDGKETKQLLSELVEVFQKTTDKQIRILLVGTGNRELVYWMYENGELEKIR